MNKIKWSAILHDAADKHLQETEFWVDGPREKESQYSCDCIYHAASSRKIETKTTKSFLDNLAENLGLDKGMDAFNEFEPGEERQGARYAWLKFAAMYYEEQGN